MITPYDKHDIVHITGIDHPESIGIGPRGEAYTTGTGCQVYRIDLTTNTAEPFARTPRRCLGQAVDADGVAKHTLTIKKVDENGADVITGSEAIRILSTAGVPISDTTPTLVNGAATIEVGAVSAICDMTISARDEAAVLRGGDVRIRFK